MALPLDFNVKLLASLLPSEHVSYREFTATLRVGHKTYSRNFINISNHNFAEVELQVELKRQILQVTRELFYKLAEDMANELPDICIRDLITWGNRQVTVDVDITSPIGATMRIDPPMIDTSIPLLSAEPYTYAQAYIDGACFEPSVESKKQLPNKKAMELLRKQIGDVNYHALMHKGYFTFLGRYGLYYFHNRKDAGVELQQDIVIGHKTRTVKWQLCVNSVIETMPLGDIILSRYLECKNNEDNFIKTANFRQVATEDEYEAF